MPTQHDQMSKLFTTSLESALEVVSGVTECITQDTVMERYDTGVERLSEGIAFGTEMREVDSEDSPVSLDVIDMDRRWVDFKEYANDVSVKKADQVRSAVQPNSAFVLAQVHAINRLADKTLINAAEAVAYGGKNGTVVRNLVAGSTIAHGGVGFTVGKANDIIEKLKTRGQVADGEDITLLWNAKMEKTFKMTAEVASNLYSNAMVIDQGYVKRWGPLVFKRIEDFMQEGVVKGRMLPFVTDGVSGGVHLRKAIAYTKKSFTRWRPLTASGVVTWEQRLRRWIISADSYVGAARRLDDSVVIAEVAET